jgi:hypothetical protein
MRQCRVLPWSSSRSCRVRNAVRLAPLPVRMVIRVGSVRRAADLKQDLRRGSQFVTHQYQVLMFEPLMESR